MHLRFNQKYQKWWFGNFKEFWTFFGRYKYHLLNWVDFPVFALFELNNANRYTYPITGMELCNEIYRWNWSVLFLSLYFLCLTQCKKCFLKKKKVLEKSVRPTTTSDQCWLEEYSLKSGVPPSIAFIKARSVYQGHITVQDTSFAKIGLHIPVHCKSRNL